jgi:gentisate 1,2-dioxygenase
MNGMTSEQALRQQTPNARAERLERLERLHGETSKLSLFEFWGEDAAREHEATERLQFRVAAVPHMWRYRDIHPLLLEAAQLIPLELSERRSLIMMNPALRPAIATVTTLFAAYRINVPHEIAPAHRHSPNAIRFGLTGNTNFTSVDGENITFGPGDLVLTPHDTWHNHGNGPDNASVNLSVLDMPLANFLNATYFEHDYKEASGGTVVAKKVQSAKVPDDYSHRIYGTAGLLPRHVSHARGAGTSSPQFVYRWEHTAALLSRLRDDAGSPYEGILLEYVNPATGGPVYKTMTFFMQLLRPGEKLLPVRQNASQTCTVYGGQGSSVVGNGNAAQRFDWERFDTFCIPGGEWFQHSNTGTDDALLFIASDEPVLRALGFALKHGRSDSGELVLLESSKRTA